MISISADMAVDTVDTEADMAVDMDMAADWPTSTTAPSAADMADMADMDMAERVQLDTDTIEPNACLRKLNCDAFDIRTMPFCHRCHVDAVWKVTYLSYHLSVWIKYENPATLFNDGKGFASKDGR